MIGAFLFIITMVLVWGVVGGDAESTKELVWELGLKAAATLATIAVYPGLYAFNFVAAIPNEWREQKACIEQLEESNQSRLALSLTDSPIHLPKGYLTQPINPNLSSRTSGTLVRVVVSNTSTNRSVEDVRCVIPKIEGQDHAFMNTKLQPLAGPLSFQLAPGGGQVVGVLFVPDDQAMELFIDYDKQLTDVGRTLPRKDHRILVQAQGKDVASQSRWLVVNLEGKGVKAHLEN